MNAPECVAEWEGEVRSLTERHQQWEEPVLCTDTALLYICKASSISCAKLCFGLRPLQLLFGLYLLFGLPFLWEAAKPIEFFKRKWKLNFRKGPQQLLEMEQWYWMVSIGTEREGWKRRCFNGTWLDGFVF